MSGTLEALTPRPQARIRALPGIRRPARTTASVLLVLLLAGCMGSHNRPLQLVSGAGPIYPPEARAAGVQGDVVVRYDVSVDGRVSNARVDQADPAGMFDQAALAAIRSWRYNPRIRDGEPEAVSNVVSTVRFRLDDDDYYDQY